MQTAEETENNKKCCVMLKDGEASDHILLLANMMGAGGNWINM
jgi:hypothetical protein